MVTSTVYPLVTPRRVLATDTPPRRKPRKPKPIKGTGDPQERRIVRRLNATQQAIEKPFSQELVLAFQRLGELASAAASSKWHEVLAGPSDINTRRLALELQRRTRRLTTDIVKAIPIENWRHRDLDTTILKFVEQTAGETQRVLNSALKMQVMIPDEQMRRIIGEGGTRLGLRDIRRDTKRAIYRSLMDSRAQGDHPYVAARRIRQYVSAGRFTNAGVQYRSRLIARTETKYAQNRSSLEYYKVNPRVLGCRAFDAQLGAERSDPHCIMRNGRIFTPEEAERELAEEHPNGTLSFAPVTRRWSPGTEDEAPVGLRWRTKPLKPLKKALKVKPPPPPPKLDKPAALAQTGAQARNLLDQIYSTQNEALQSARETLHNIDVEAAEIWVKLMAEKKLLDQGKGDIFYYGALYNQRKDLLGKRIPLKVRIKKIDDELYDDAIKAVQHGEDGADVPWVWEGQHTDADLQMTRAGFSQFKRLVKNWDNQDHKVSVKISDQRAHYQRTGVARGRVVYRGDQDKNFHTLIHELGHAFENQAEGLQQEAVDFLASRTKGEKLVKMADLFPHRNYKQSERTWVDKWDHPYTGKSYRRKEKPWDNNYGYAHDPKLKGQRVVSTEIVSMGLEAMSRNPKKFADTDPEFFDWIFEHVMRRG